MLNRAFLSLYAFIVIAVIFLGWGLNQFWESLEPDTAVPTEIIDLMTLVAEDIYRTEDVPARLSALNNILQVQVSLLEREDFAKTDFYQQLTLGNLLTATDAQGRPVFYQAITDDQILVLKTELPILLSKWYYLLSALFYAGIALIIFIWMWPLARDLTQLKKSAHQLGKDGKFELVQVPKRSALKPLAETYNAMAARIEELISSHQDMTSAVSHELRTPLARMKFALAMLETSSQSATNTKQLDSVKQDIIEMEALINALLHYAGFEKSSRCLDSKEGYLTDLLSASIATFQKQHAHKLTIDLIANEELARGWCEWKLMETAVKNLIGNATRFAKSRIVVTLASSETHYRIIIEDDGIGISEENYSRIFDPFIRLYNEQDKPAGGFGLGLSIVKRILSWHGGEACVEKSSLGGAAFILSWPVPQVNL